MVGPLRPHHHRQGSVQKSHPTNGVADVAKHEHEPLLPIPSTVELLLRNLRFLDLDLQQDWPRITSDTFIPAGRDTISRSRSRVQIGEWILFKLLELYDPRETRHKLQQFFPALEPKQSIALRSGLFQILTNIKNAGVLPPECSLRRSLLDECKGERFVELLFHLSSAVLHRRVTMPSPDGMALQSALSRNTFGEIEASLIKPLSLSLQDAVTRSLRSRSNLTSRLNDFRAILDSKSQVINSRMSGEEADVEMLKNLLYESNANTTQLKAQLRTACEANPSWVNLAISGDNDMDRDSWFDMNFEHLWDRARYDSLSSNEEPRTRHLTACSNLDQQIHGVRDRLENWRAFQSTLSMRNEAFTTLRSPTKTPVRPTPQRSPKKSPQKLGLAQRNATPSHIRTGSASKVSSGLQTSLLRRSTKSISTSRGERLDAAPVTGASQDLIGILGQSKLPGDLAVSSDLASDPLENTMRQEKMHHDKLSPRDLSTRESQRKQQGNLSSLNSSTPIEKIDPFEPIYESRKTPRAFTVVRPYITSSQPTSAIAAAVGPHVTADKLPSSPTQSQANVPNIGNAEHGMQNASTALQTPLEGKSRLSLAERARQSMVMADALQSKRLAFLSSAQVDAADIGDSSSRSRSRPSSSETGLPASSGTGSEMGNGLHDSLTDRARASMAHLLNPAAPDRPRSNGQDSTSRIPNTRGHRKSRSAVTYPVNPFGNGVGIGAQRRPGTTEELTSALDAMRLDHDGHALANVHQVEDAGEHKTKRPTTPKEQLLSGEADYASVFKSRSKMRHSPPPPVTAISNDSPWS